MSNADFQDRLKRIAGSTSNQDQRAPAGGPVGRRGPNYLRLALGAAILSIGVQTTRYANQNYEAIRDGAGIGAGAGLGLAGFVLVLIGAVLMIRAFFGGKPNVSRAAYVPERPVQGQGRARTVMSLFSFTTGFVVCLALYVAAVATNFGTEAARLFGTGIATAAIWLTAVCTTLGLIGLLFRIHALVHMPLFLFAGFILTWGTLRVLGLNFYDWPPLVALLSGLAP